MKLYRAWMAVGLVMVGCGGCGGLLVNSEVPTSCPTAQHIEKFVPDKSDISEYSQTFYACFPDTFEPYDLFNPMYGGGL